MTSDLLFSVLPREGKVPIAHEKQKVYKMDKQGNLKPLSDKEQELKAEEREARQNQNSKHDKGEPDNTSQDEAALAPEDKPQKNSSKPKGPKHLDIYV